MLRLHGVLRKALGVGTARLDMHRKPLRSRNAIHCSLSVEGRKQFLGGAASAFSMQRSSGQYTHVVGKLVPLPLDAENDYEFENEVVGGRIPTEYIPSVDKGFQMARAKGPLTGYEIVKVKMILEDGSSHAVDSSDLAFQICGRDAFKEAFLKSKPVLLEPIMKVEVEVPTEFQGNVSGDIASRRGLIVNSEIKDLVSVITAEVPLANMFGYSTDVRSMTQGKATFSMEFLCYRRTPASIQAEVIDAAQKAKKEGAKK